MTPTFLPRLPGLPWQPPDVAFPKIALFWFDTKLRSEFLSYIRQIRPE